MIYQWKEKYLKFHKSAVVNVGSGHDFRKLRSKAMYYNFPKCLCIDKTNVIKIDSTKLQKNERCVLTQTPSLQL